MYIYIYSCINLHMNIYVDPKKKNLGGGVIAIGPGGIVHTTQRLGIKDAAVLTYERSWRAFVPHLTALYINICIHVYISALYVYMYIQTVISYDIYIPIHVYMLHVYIHGYGYIIYVCIYTYQLYIYINMHIYTYVQSYEATYTYIYCCIYV